jgi:hypothetical protein
VDELDPPEERRDLRPIVDIANTGVPRELWFARRTDGSWGEATPPRAFPECDYLVTRYHFFRAARILDAVQALSPRDQRPLLAGPGPYIALFRGEEAMFPDSVMIYDLLRMHRDLWTSLRAFVEVFKDAPAAWDRSWYQTPGLQARLRSMFPASEFNLSRGLVGIALFTATSARSATP